MDWNDVFFVIGVTVALASVLPFLIRFSPEQEEEEKAAFEKAQFDVLHLRAERANEALRASVEIVEEYQRKNKAKA